MAVDATELEMWLQECEKDAFSENGPWIYTFNYKSIEKSGISE